MGDGGAAQLVDSISSSMSVTAEESITRQPTPTMSTAVDLEKQHEENSGMRNTEAVHELDDKVLLGHRSCMESIVLCFANLIPPVGVA